MKTEKNKKTKLNLRQEKFCQLFTGEKEFFGNGVESYLAVYDIDKKKSKWYDTACVNASKLLSNTKVIARISELLDEKGLNDSNVDKQLLFLINQHSDNKVKLGAIREYNILRQRITKKLNLDASEELREFLLKLNKIIDE